ncbi:MAG TPA: phenylalanine 4-monooxygenase [Acidobacteriaceae bacterium]
MLTLSQAPSSSFTPYLIEQKYSAYSEEQHAVWGELVSRRMRQLAEHAAEEYLAGLEAIGLRTDDEARLPDVVEVTARLKRRTGWSTVPVSGFMPGPAFFEMLSLRQFPVTTWLRSRESFEYTPEPDIFHDVFGHVPMHAHPVFADFLADYGKLCASIADEALLERIGRLFWYTVEFGLIWQRGAIKVYGSGLISSHGECSHVLEGRCRVEPFKLAAVLAAPVRVDAMHERLFAIDHFDELYTALKSVAECVKNGDPLPLE